MWGETFDKDTGKKIHDDGIDDHKVYIGTRSDGSDRMYIGQKENFRDMTNQFHKQLDATTSFFTKQDQKFSQAEANIGAGWGGKLLRRLSFFQEPVTDKGPFDIKQPGKGFDEVEIGEYSFFDGNLFRYDDYGNFNYGAAARDFGLTKSTALLGAGLNQFGKTVSINYDNSSLGGRGDVLNLGTSIRFNWQYIKSNWYPSNIQGFTDDPQDTSIIIRGFNR